MQTSYLIQQPLTIAIGINTFETKTKILSPLSKTNYPLIPRSNESICGHVQSSLANFQKASRPKTAIRSCDTSPQMSYLGICKLTHFDVLLCNRTTASDSHLIMILCFGNGVRFHKGLRAHARCSAIRIKYLQLFPVLHPFLFSSSLVKEVPL